MTDVATLELNAEQIASAQTRLTQLRKRLAEADLSGLLVSSEHDIWYLTGFVGHSALLFLTDQRAGIICDRRYEVLLQAWDASDLFEVVMGARHKLGVEVKRLSDEAGLNTVGIQAESMTIAFRDGLAKSLGDLELVPTSDLVSALRQRKTAEECALIERAIGIQEAALEATLADLRIGMTEAHVAARLEYEMRVRGAESASFEAIIGSGPNSSVIHHIPGDRAIEDGMLLVDWGARVEGYCSDLTRTMCFGSMPEPMERVYEVVLEALETAIEACQPGADCAHVDAAARDVIAAAGWGDQFPHGLGHGVGMDVHESPFFSNRSGGILLEPGMIMTVEPGIYLPGVGGVRIEEDVLITETGHRVLSTWPRDLDSAKRPSLKA
ncbi:MAG: Xaa-Pro peptidase family protein [Planctomycetota bacterium]|nr:Xaa-Pro peptidase family protein [Planctomycetota bacterium]